MNLLLKGFPSQVFDRHCQVCPLLYATRLAIDFIILNYLIYFPMCTSKKIIASFLHFSQ